jgi:hypothetical protein
MYPSDKCGILYGFDDLPDVIQFEAGPYDLAYKVSGGNGAVYRTPWVYWPEYDSEWQAEIGGIPILSQGPDGGIEAWVPIDSDIAPEWKAAERFRPDGYDDLRGMTIDSTCLFGGFNIGVDPWPALPASNNWNLYVQDNFEDAYSVSGLTSGTVVRTDRCEWLTTGLSLFFSSSVQKWQINGLNKNGNQNDPVGSYGNEDEYSVS